MYGTDKEIYLSKVSTGKDYIDLEKRSIKLRISSKKYPNSLIIKKVIKDIIQKIILYLK